MPVSRALKAIRNAFLSRGFLLFGPRFSRDYLRFATKAARQWGHTGPGVVELLGYRVAYPNQSYALFLLHEIFVDAAYAFRGRRGRPYVVDCGANIGLSVVFFKAYAPDATILAIEPEPATFEYLRDTIATNKLTNVELLNAAVSRTEGTVQFYGNPADDGGITASLYPAWGGGVARDVPAIRLSSVIDKPVDVLKLDIEGAEYDVVDDLIDSGTIQLVKETVIETHEVEERPAGRDRMVARLRESGFDVSIVREDPSARVSLVHGVARRIGVQLSVNRTPSTSRTTSA